MTRCVGGRGRRVTPNSLAMVVPAVPVLDGAVAEVGFRREVDGEGASAELTLGIAEAFSVGQTWRIAAVSMIPTSSGMNRFGVT